MKLRGLLSFIVALGAAKANGQFTAEWFHDEKFWGDGKAEFSFYEAKQVRYGQPRSSEVIHILVREPFSPKELVKTENAAQPGAYQVIKLNQILRIPTGIYVYQQMHSSYWRADSGALIKATLTSNDSCGNTYKEFRATDGIRSLFARGWQYEWRTYWEEMASGTESFRAPPIGAFYDELPVRVRTINFQGDSGGFDIQLAPSVINSKKDAIKFEPAKVTWRKEGELIRVEVAHRNKTDVLQLEGRSPHLLRDWQQFDGGSLKLQRSLKIDYWNYNKVGDKERALGR